MQPLTIFQELLAGGRADLGADLVLVVLAPLNKHDTVTARDIEEVCAVGGDEQLVARLREVLELTHEAALSVRVEVKLRLLDA